ncbi:MAG: tetratricopeptide repeat protein [Alphaproteobacteria bacterium]|nr:tetratricopeptide repeat protein [Alphaproteobacteria bacterium]
MKKTSFKKNDQKNRAKVRPVASKPTVNIDSKKACANPWSLSIYVYWFIILFFIAATFYILGRSHNATQNTNEVQITEEVLMQAADYYEKGREKLVAGNIDEAIADLTTAIDAGAASVDTYILRGEAHMQSGDYRAAMDDFNTALFKDPTNAVAYYDRALLSTRLEDYNAALADINNALAANAQKPSPMLQMRNLYAKRGQLNLWLKNWEGAIADYTNSLARPEGTVDPVVYAERAEAYTAIGNYAEAINDYSSAIRVISEQIQGAPTLEERESLSNNAMNYFEKSAALNLNIGNIDAARTDLESAYTIAIALNNTETADRLQGLINELTQVTTPVQPEQPTQPVSPATPA